MSNSLPPEFCFPSIFETYNQIETPIVYRLIDAALIEFFSMIPSYFKVEISTTCDQLNALGG